MFIELVGVCIIVYVCLNVVENCNKSMKSIYHEEIDGMTVQSDY